MARSEEKRAHYERLVADVLAGESVAAVAQKHGVHPNTVRNAIRDQGASVPTSTTNSAMQILRRLLEGEEPASIAKRLGVTRQRIHAVKQDAEKAGVFKAAANYQG